jgi:adenylate kinase family enzyme
MTQMVDRVAIVGNSGSGKSTLALRLARSRGLAHLDLDTLAWEPVTPPVRRPLAVGITQIEHGHTHARARSESAQSAHIHAESRQIIVGFTVVRVECDLDERGRM